jgi:hypothetical protein
MIRYLHIMHTWCRNPTLAKCGGEAQHFQSWGFGVLRDSRMFRVRQQGPKHLALRCSWCHWKGLEAYISKMASHWPFGHLQPKLWAKEGPEVKLAVWFLTTKSLESTSSRPPNWECDTSLERSQRGLQVWFKPRRNQTSQSGVISSQSPGTPPETISGQFRDFNPGVPGKSDIRAWVPRSVTEYTIGNKVVAYSRVGAVVCFVVQSACGLSQHPRVSRNVN